MSATGEIGRDSEPTGKHRLGLSPASLFRPEHRRLRQSSALRTESVSLLRSWQVPAGRTWMGQVIPGMVLVIGALALTGAIYLPIDRGGAVGLGPSVILGLLSVVAGWLFWKVIGTVWMIDAMSDDRLRCRASRRC